MQHYISLIKEIWHVFGVNILIRHTAPVPYYMYSLYCAISVCPTNAFNCLAHLCQQKTILSMVNCHVILSFIFVFWFVYFCYFVEEHLECWKLLLRCWWFASLHVRRVYLAADATIRVMAPTSNPYSSDWFFSLYSCICRL